MGRYTNIKHKRNSKGVRYYRTNTYPDIPRSISDVYVITQAEDRYDKLALQYYSDSSLWWIISNANPEYINGSLYPPIGIQLRIPVEIAQILNTYRRINE
tara:strand:- start:141 stop:440 length:300 start_codon:yes stop_codon:yes gene_type:complete